MKFNFYLKIEDLQIDEGKGIKNLDINVSQDMSPEEFIEYVTMVPALVAELVNMAQIANGSDSVVASDRMSSSAH